MPIDELAFTPQNSCRVTASKGVDCTLPLQLDPPQNKTKQNTKLFAFGPVVRQKAFG